MHTVRSRILAIAVAITAGLAGASSSLAHGAEHAREADDHAFDTSAVIEHHHEQHSHTVVNSAPTARVSHVIMVLPPHADVSIHVVLLPVVHRRPPEITAFADPPPGDVQSPRPPPRV
jgi:hypothetical protein